MLINMENKLLGELNKIKWNRAIFKLITPTHSMFSYLVDMHNTTKMQHARCKQEHGWHINNLHIFLIKIDIKFALFGVID